MPKVKAETVYFSVFLSRSALVFFRLMKKCGELCSPAGKHNSSSLALPLCLFNHYLFRQVGCLQHKPAAVAGVFPVFGLSECVCVKYVRQARAYGGLHSNLQGSLTTCRCAIKPDAKIRHNNFHFFFFSQILQERGSALLRSPSQKSSGHVWVRPPKTHQT